MHPINLMNGWMNRNLKIWNKMGKRQKNFKKILKFVQKTVDFPIKYSKIKEYFCIHNK